MTFPVELYGMSPRMGKLKEIEKFDGAFFGLMSETADAVDPHSRILLETTHEAICDAGIPSKYFEVAHKLYSYTFVQKV